MLAPKKSNKRKGTLQLVPPEAGCPRGTISVGGPKTRYAQTVWPLNPPEIAALGCVAMGPKNVKEKQYRFFNTNDVTVAVILKPPFGGRPKASSYGRG